MKNTSQLITRLAIGLAATLSFASAFAEIESGPFVSPVNGHIYFRLTSSGWIEAEAQAVAMGGHLATIRNAAENAWIYQKFGNRNIWIGLNDAGTEGSFHWVSGEPATYWNFAGGEPNNNGDEDYVHFYPAIYGSEWNDVMESGASIGTILGLVEIVPPQLRIAVLGNEIRLQWEEDPFWGLAWSESLAISPWTRLSHEVDANKISTHTSKITSPRAFFRLEYIAPE